MKKYLYILFAILIVGLCLSSCKRRVPGATENQNKNSSAAKKDLKASKVGERKFKLTFPATLDDVEDGISIVAFIGNGKCGDDTEWKYKKVVNKEKETETFIAEESDDFVFNNKYCLRIVVDADKSYTDPITAPNPTKDDLVWGPTDFQFNKEQEFIVKEKDLKKFAGVPSI